MLQIMGKVSSQYVICDGYSSCGHLLLVVGSGCDVNVVRYGLSARYCEHATIVGVVLLWTEFCPRPSQGETSGQRPALVIVCLLLIMQFNNRHSLRNCIDFQLAVAKTT